MRRIVCSALVAMFAASFTPSAAAQIQYSFERQPSEIPLGNPFGYLRVGGTGPRRQVTPGPNLTPNTNAIGIFAGADPRNYGPLTILVDNLPETVSGSCGSHADSATAYAASQAVINLGFQPIMDSSEGLIADANINGTSGAGFDPFPTGVIASAKATTDIDYEAWVRNCGPVGAVGEFEGVDVKFEWGFVGTGGWSVFGSYGIRANRQVVYIVQFDEDGASLFLDTTPSECDINNDPSDWIELDARSGSSGVFTFNLAVDPGVVEDWTDRGGSVGVCGGTKLTTDSLQGFVTDGPFPTLANALGSVNIEFSMLSSE